MNKHILTALAIGMLIIALHAFSRGIGYQVARALWRHL